MLKYPEGPVWGGHPGQPHILKERDPGEGDVYYMGYDFRYNKKHIEEDCLAIRRLYWVEDASSANPGYWPTIWQPITVSFHSDVHPEAIGKPLKISFGNTGAGSTAAFDNVSISYHKGTANVAPPDSELLRED